MQTAATVASKTWPLFSGRNENRNPTTYSATRTAINTYTKHNTHTTLGIKIVSFKRDIKRSDIKAMISKDTLRQLLQFFNFRRSRWDSLTKLNMLCFIGLVLWYLILWLRNGINQNIFISDIQSLSWSTKCD